MSSLEGDAGKNLQASDEQLHSAATSKSCRVSSLNVLIIRTISFKHSVTQVRKPGLKICSRA